MALKKETAEVEVKLSAEDAQRKIKELTRASDQLNLELAKMGKDDSGRKETISQINKIDSEVVALRKSLKSDVRVVINGEAAGATLKDLRGAQVVLTREMQLFGDKTDPVYIRKAEQLKLVSQRIIELEAPIRDAKKGLLSMADDGSLAELSDRANKLRAELDLLKPSSERFVAALGELSAVENEMAQITAQTKLAKAEFTEIGEIGSLTFLKAKAEGLRQEIEGMTVGTQAYIEKSKELAGVEVKIDQIKVDAAGLRAEMKGIGTEDSLNALKLKAESLRIEINKLSPASKEFTESLARLNVIDAQIDEITNSTKALKAEFTEIGQVGSFTFLKAKAEGLRKEIDQLAPSTKEFVNKSRELQQVEGRMNSLNTTIKGTGGLWNKLGDSVKQFGALALGYLGFQALTSQIQNIIAKNAQLDDSIANVMQTTGLTKDEVKSLNSEFSKLNTRTSRQELLEIAKVAGQFGVAKDQIVGFTQAVNKATVVLKNEFRGGAEEITTTIAGLRNVLSDIKSDKIDEDIMHISNGLIVLAQEGVATAPVVADFANRIGGIGISLGLTSGQVLGLSATLQELSVSTERGGTAIGKILQKMTQNTEDFARVAGYDGSAGKSLQDFEKLVNTNIYEAFLKFVEGSKRGGDSATAFSKILKDSELSGAGASEVVAKLAANIGLLNGRVKLSGDAIKETSSITDQYNIKNENFAAQLEKLQKRIGSLFANVEAGNFLKGIVSGLNKLLDTTPRFEELNEEWKLLAEGTRNLENNISPLLSRYDQLKTKTTLTTAEQDELKKIIEKVSLVLPTAITRVDEYGNALDISTKRAHEFIEAQQLLTESKNKDAIGAQEKQLKLLEYNVSTVQASLNKMLITGQKVITTSGTAYAEGTSTVVKASNEDIKSVQNTLADLQKQAKAAYLQLKELKGLPLVDDRDQFKFKQPDIRPGIKPEAFNIKNTNSTNNVTTNSTTNKVETQIKTTVTTEGTEESKRQLEEYRKTVAEHQSRINDLMNQLSRVHIEVIKDEGERVIAELDQNYKEKRERAQKDLADVLKDEKLSAAQKSDYKQLANDIALAKETQYQEKRKELISKYSEELANAEFDQDIKNLEEWMAARKLALTQNYADEKITREQFEKELEELELKSLQLKLQIAKDYGKSTQDIEQAIATFKAKLRDKDSQESADAATKKAESEYYAFVKGQAKILYANIDNIRKERDLKIAAAKGNVAEIAKINEEANAAELEEWKKFYMAKQQEVDRFYNAVKSIAHSFNTIQDNRENAELAKDKRANDIKKNNLKRQLDAKIITQEQYNERVGELDEKQHQKEGDRKRKQWRRNKRTAVSEAIIQGILSVVRTLAEYAYPYNLIFGALDALVVGAEVAAIESEPEPEFKRGKKPYVWGKGGVPEGPSHADGGIDLVDSKTKKKIGEMEGGEPILSVDTYENNKPVVDALVDSSLNNGGKKIDISAIEKSTPSTLPAGTIGIITDLQQKYQRVVDRFEYIQSQVNQLLAGPSLLQFKNYTVEQINKLQYQITDIQRNLENGSSISGHGPVYESGKPPVVYSSGTGSSTSTAEISTFERFLESMQEVLNLNISNESKAGLVTMLNQVTSSTNETDRQTMIYKLLEYTDRLAISSYKTDVSSSEKTASESLSDFSTQLRLFTNTVYSSSS